MRGTQRVKEITMEVITEKSNKGHMAYFKEFTFTDLIAWVYRNCGGCLEIKIVPEVSVQAIFEDRIELYTLSENDIPDNFELER